MMDANGDYNYERDKDKDLERFIWEAKSADPYHERFPAATRTYIFGKKGWTTY